MNPEPSSAGAAQLAFNTLMSSAEGLIREGRFLEAELRLTEALGWAQKNFGQHSDQVMLVLCITAAFYRQRNRDTEASKLEERLQNWGSQRDGSVEIAPPKEPKKAMALPGLKSVLNRTNTAKSVDVAPKKIAKTLPANIRRACQLLGIALDSELTATSVQKMWKKQMLNSAAHPDLGGNTEEAMLLNQAKIDLLEYLEFIKPRQRSTWKVPGLEANAEQ